MAGAAAGAAYVLAMSSSAQMEVLMSCIVSTAGARDLERECVIGGSRGRLERKIGR